MYRLVDLLITHEQMQLEVGFRHTTLHLDPAVEMFKLEGYKTKKRLFNSKAQTYSKIIPNKECKE